MDLTLEELRKRVLALEYTDQELAAKSGVTPETIRRILNGQTRAPKRKTIQALEQLLKGTSDQQAIPDFFPGENSRQGSYTLKDYYALPEERRAELIDGVLYDMASPLALHQGILTELLGQFRNIIRKNKGNCRVFPAPFDVQLDRNDHTMVQPDLSIICRRDHLNRKGGFGAPDLIVEILSKSTRNKDMLIKLKKYLEAGVREYWIVDPDQKKIVVYRNMPDNLIPQIYTFRDQIPIGIWNNCDAIDFADIDDQIKDLYDEQPRTMQHPPV